MKYPIGIQSFEEIRTKGFVYVDKTALVYRMVTEGKVYFLSRPRRFGKSLLLSTLKAYFQGKRALFEGLAMEGLEADWAVHPVFHVDFANKNFNRPDELEEAIESFIAAAEHEYGKDEFATTVGDRFASVLAKAKERYGQGAVVLVDEYDKPLLDVLGTPQEERNRNVLKAFYSTFKSADDHLRFVMLTGVTKFSQISVFSGFNQPRDISMVERYDTLCGITEKELHQTFATSIRAMARKKKQTVKQTKEDLRAHYDGYHFSSRLKGVYNPFSVLSALDNQEIGDYWFATGTPTYLIRLMEHFDENMCDMLSRYYPASEFVDYRADVQRPLPMLYQSGYLTIKDFNPHVRTYRLDFPNHEVTSGFVTLVANQYLKPSEGTESWITRVAEALRLGQLEALRQELTAFFAGIPYHLRRKQGLEEQERDFQYTFFLIIKMVSAYRTVVEKAQSQGRVDCVVETPDYIYLFEFKRDGTAQAALQQIRDMGYAREYASDHRRLYAIGCNFSTRTGTIDDWAVEELLSIARAEIDQRSLDDLPDSSRGID